MTAPEPLERTIAAAQAEAEAADRAALDATRRQTAALRRRARWRQGLGLGLLAAAAAATAGLWRAPAPSEEALRAGRARLLDLAAAAVADHVARHGRLPADLAELLPAAAEVRLRRVDAGLELSITPSDGSPPLRRLLPLGPGGRA